MRRQILGLALGLALVGAGSAQALVIDSFSTPQTTIISAGGVGGSNMAISPAGSIAAGGGTRTMSLTVGTQGDPFDLLTISPAGNYVLAAGSDAIVMATLTWTPAAPVNLFASSVPGQDGCTSLDNCFLIFGVNALDHALSVSVTLTDGPTGGVQMASNTYLKYHHQIPPDPAGADTLFCTDGLGDQCPQIVGSIFGDPGAPAAVFGNYYHALSLFAGGGVIDPATGAAFGGNPLIDFTDITSIVFSLTTPGNALDFSVDCVYTSGRASTGTETQPLPGGATQTYPTFSTSTTDGDRNACASTVVPEPASLLLLGTGFLGVGLVGLKTRRMRRQKA